jgi:hypothetical protein
VPIFRVLYHVPGCDGFHLFDDQLDGFGLLFRWVLVLHKQPFDGRPQVGAYVVAHGPVGLDIAPHDGNQLTCDLRQHVVALEFNGGVVRADRVVERQLVM